MAPGYFSNSPATAIAIAAVAIVLPSYWLVSRRRTAPEQPSLRSTSTTQRTPFAVGDRQLQEPRDDPFTLAEVLSYSMNYLVQN